MRLHHHVSSRRHPYTSAVALTASLLAVSLLLACGDEDEGDLAPSAEIEAVTPSPEAKADGGEIRIRVGETSLWVRPNLRREDGDSGDVLILRGRTSRNITGGGASHPANQGAFHQPSPRVFEVKWPVAQTAAALDGRGHVVAIDLLESAGRADSIAANAALGLHVQQVEGDGVRLDGELRSYVKGMEVVHRLVGHASGNISDMTVQVGERFIEAETSGADFFVDLDSDAVARLASTGEPLFVTTWLGHVRVTTEVVLGASIRLLEAGAWASPEELWPARECEDETRECLFALPSGQLDLDPCGEAAMVRDCKERFGTVVGEAHIFEAMKRAGGGLDALVSDAHLLVGQARSPELAESVEQHLRSALDAREGAPLLDEQAAAKALDDVTASVLTAAYARPLSFVRPLEPIPGDEAHAADIAADGLLLYLADYDLRRSEYRRTIEDLVDRWPGDHLAALSEIREGGVELWRDSWIAVTSWMSSYAEVRVDPETGEVFHIVVEIP